MVLPWEHSGYWLVASHAWCCHTQHVNSELQNYMQCSKFNISTSKKILSNSEYLVISLTLSSKLVPCEPLVIHYESKQASEHTVLRPSVTKNFLDIHVCT